MVVRNEINRFIINSVFKEFSFSYITYSIENMFIKHLKP